MIATFGGDMDATILGYVAAARSNIANWQNANKPAVSPKAETPSPKRSSSAVAAAFVGLLCAVFIVVVANRALNNPSASSSGSQSASDLNPGGGSGGSSGGNPGGIVTAPAAATPAPYCQQSNDGSNGGWDLHHMVDTSSTAQCWAHEIVDLGSGCQFFVDSQPFSSAVVNIWNITDWGYGSGDTAGQVVFFTAGGHTLLYACIQNGHTEPQTTLHNGDW